MQMEKHIINIAIAGEDVYEQLCRLGLAMLGDESTEQQRRRSKHETLQAINKLKSCLDSIIEEYDLTGTIERAREQLI